MITVLVLTISDRAAEGIYEDKSGPAVQEVLSENFLEITIDRKIVSDDADKIRHVFQSNLSYDFIITTGGTGIGPRDNTPEVTQDFCERMIPGISEMLRFKSFEQTANAVLSRGVSGIKGKTVIINLPGSVKGAKFCTERLLPIMPHIQQMRDGKGH